LLKAAQLRGGRIYIRPQIGLAPAQLLLPTALYHLPIFVGFNKHLYAYFMPKTPNIKKSHELASIFLSCVIVEEQ
jgi:hypothetical protein